MGPGPTHLRFFLQIALSYSLLAWKTSKYHHNKFISQIFNENMLPLLQKLNLKSLSEQTRWLPFFLMGWCNTTKSLAISFSEQERDVFVRLWCHLMGIPPKSGIPHDFGRFRLVKCITITKLNVTIPVLFKTSIKASSHPSSPPPSSPPSLPHPYTPHPYPQQYVYRSHLWRVSDTPPCPPTPTPTPWFCPPHKHTHNFCID